MINYREKPCRINTYGNSFTQCHQVSDHETWQEVLAGHLQEPVRNFGIGGWSVYQAWLRLQVEEARTPAELIIFNIYEDDHLRNLDAWRNIRVRKHPQHIESTLPYVEVDIKKGEIRERPNPCPTQESFTQLCDLDRTVALFKDDFVLKIMLAHQQADSPNPGRAFADMEALSRTHGIETRIDSSETLSRAADTLHKRAGLTASMRLTEKILSHAAAGGKQVLFILSYPAQYIAETLATGNRWDQAFIDFLSAKNCPVVDLCALHATEASDWKSTPEAYLKRYFIGHYNPVGNMFCAFAVKDQVVALLDPKPPAYRQSKENH